MDEVKPPESDVSKSSEGGLTWPDLFVRLPVGFLMGVIGLLGLTVIYSIVFNRPINLGLLGMVGPIPDAPADSIIAFKDKCPDNWTLFRPAIGRFVVGAGDPKKAPEDMAYDEKHRPLILRSPSSHGGQLRHLLMPEEAPTVTHSGVAQSPSSHTQVVTMVTDVGLKAAAQDFEIIPPYVALVYCKKGVD